MSGLGISDEDRDRIVNKVAKVKGFRFDDQSLTMGKSAFTEISIRKR